MPDAEKTFLDKVAQRVPGLAGYREASARRETDLQLREHIAGELELLRSRVAEIREVAEEEQDPDMVDDITRLDERLDRTAGALRSADYGSAEFFTRAEMQEQELARVYEFDSAMLEDLDLLSRDVGGLKYDNIGTLTLREVEGTLASIELRVANRKHLFENPKP
jgi:hypothetical protein